MQEVWNAIKVGAKATCKAVKDYPAAIGLLAVAYLKLYVVKRHQSC